MPRWIAWPGPWSNTPAEPPNLLGGKPINSPIFKAIISPNNRFMRKALLLAALFVCTTLTVMAQRMVTGKILDANGMPVSGVTIKALKSGKMAVSRRSQTGAFTEGVVVDRPPFLSQLLGKVPHGGNLKGAFDFVVP